MDLKQILLLVVTGLYFWFCHWFICTKTFKCNEGLVTDQVASAGIIEEERKGIAPAPVAPPPRPQDPILFNWESNRPVTSSFFPEFKSEIVNGKATDNILEITGKYFADEAKPEKYANIGLARADKIKQLFLDEVPEERIRLRARLVADQEGMQDDLFRSASFKWTNAVPESYDNIEDVARVEELGDRALVYFPFNSVDKEIDGKVDTYLAKIAKQVKKDGSRIELTGHTDDKGKERANLRLAKMRAEKVKKILIAKGLDSNQIEVFSKGESEPTAPNTTDANRRLNRRVVVRIVD